MKNMQNMTKQVEQVIYVLEHFKEVPDLAYIRAKAALEALQEVQKLTQFTYDCFGHVDNDTRANIKHELLIKALPLKIRIEEMCIYYPTSNIYTEYDKEKARTKIRVFKKIWRSIAANQL